MSSHAALIKRIEREQLKSYRQAKMIARATKKIQARRERGVCEVCGATKCDELYSYRDDSNIAVTASARLHCKWCWGNRPGAM